VPETTTEFLDALQQSDLLDKEQIESVLGPLAPDSPTRHDGPALAKKFVEAKLLTKFQVELLLKGRHKGFVLKGKYKILDLLGAGGMGRVFLCQHVHLNRQVAVKLLSTEQAKDISNVERFYREARAVAALDDPNIVRVYDVERDDRQPLMIMEYVDGVSLHDLVVRKGPLTVEQAANFVAQAALGLQHASEVGIVHRDIKPGNLLLDRKGVVKILDMGLARFAEKDKNESLTERYDTNSVLGTADYLAPEQAVDSSTVDIRADLYALGGTLHFLLTGRPPFSAPTVAEKLLAHQMRPVPLIRDTRTDVPAKLEQVYRKLMAKNPGDRYQTPEQLIHALAPFADATRPMKVEWDSSAETQPGKQAAPTPRSSHRRQFGGAVAVAAVLMVVLLTSGGKEGPTKIVENKREGEPLKGEVEPKFDVKKIPKEDTNSFVKPEDAQQHEGKKVTVEMTVMRVGFAKTLPRAFLNSLSDFRDPKCLTVLVDKDVSDVLYPETEFSKLDDKFRGKRIRVTGVVEIFNKQAQIKLKGAGQLDILD
jgi:serine/threonine protein kinase